MSDHTPIAHMVDHKSAQSPTDFPWFPMAIAFIFGFGSALLMCAEMSRAGVPW